MIFYFLLKKNNFRVYIMNFCFIYERNNSNWDSGLQSLRVIIMFNKSLKNLKFETEVKFIIVN